jgi:hypothetical protein
MSYWFPIGSPVGLLCMNLPSRDPSRGIIPVIILLMKESGISLYENILNISLKVVDGYPLDLFTSFYIFFI